MYSMQSFASQLTGGEKCVAFMEVGWVKDIVKIPRILYLVEKQGEYALFIYFGNKTCATSGLTLDVILPINASFKLEDGNSWMLSNESDTFVKITAEKSAYVFQLPNTPQHDNFLLCLNKVLEDIHKKPGRQFSFAWIQSYQCTGNGQFSQSVIDMFDPFTPSVMPDNENVSSADDKFNAWFAEKEEDFLASQESLQDSLVSFPRHTIAMGEAPLAGREGIIWITMDKRKEEYTNTAVFRVFAGTWNVNGQLPTVSLGDWLACGETAPNLYAVGFQELDLSKEAYLFNDSPREGVWLQAVQNGLHPSGKYKKIRLVRLVGMMLIIFVREDLADSISNVAAVTVGTGIMGKLGNKGGVAVRLDFHNTSMCFVNCHLAAHPEEYERRNQDFFDISARTVFSQFSPPKFIQDHDQVYWLGDLNYRINTLDNSTIKHSLDQNNYSDVLRYDQLKIQQRSNLAFSAYTEGQIAFAPTYKYCLGCDVWDIGRAPAWCDRILWKGEGIKQIEYRTHAALKISDHRPVSAVFNSDVKVVDVGKYRLIYELVMRQLDKLENEFLPQVTVDSMNISFDVVKFIEPQKRYLTIANTGQVPVRFKFIDKPKDKMYCKPWLSIKPCSDFIMPGDKCDVELEVYVDKQTAFNLNRQQDKIDDILVLHLENGKDLFITVNGVYQPSSFGCSLESLVHINVPVGEISPKSLADMLKNFPSTLNGSDDLDAYDIPKEIWRLVDHLAKLSLNEAHIFEQPGLPHEILQIRDCLDLYMSSSLPGNSHSVAEALLVFLEAIPEPVIPCSFYQRCIEAAPNFQLCKQIISQIPMVHHNVFKYLMAFLRLLLSECESNKLDHKTIATLFGSILLRPAQEDKVPLNKRSMHQLIDRKKATFIYHFLANDYI